MPSVTVRDVTVMAEYSMSNHTMALIMLPAWSDELHQIPF